MGDKKYNEIQDELVFKLNMDTIHLSNVEYRL
ncbi:hypothetical protein GFO_2014 [Christiangramia forsetii KT0803]|uniref:Uncharacterized protein n=1 Tax=Christiangramia forsetii (strain DSM 17595 / CGMCC 1.15422 / KT0803) TaxID=411154 RepID=A0M2Y4_CHRFK|nr:hypothetical protein GFO_2014 [Christiangramia forsetii KT0803]